MTRNPRRCIDSLIPLDNSVRLAPLSKSMPVGQKTQIPRSRQFRPTILILLFALLLNFAWPCLATVQEGDLAAQKLYLLASQKAREGKTDDAAELLQLILETYPTDPIALRANDLLNDITLSREEKGVPQFAVVWIPLKPVSDFVDLTHLEYGHKTYSVGSAIPIYRNTNELLATTLSNLEANVYSDGGELGFLLRTDAVTEAEEVVLHVAEPKFGAIASLSRFIRTYQRTPILNLPRNGLYRSFKIKLKVPIPHPGFSEFDATIPLRPILQQIAEYAVVEAVPLFRADPTEVFVAGVDSDFVKASKLFGELVPLPKDPVGATPVEIPSTFNCAYGRNASSRTYYESNGITFSQDIRSKTQRRQINKELKQTLGGSGKHSQRAKRRVGVYIYVSGNAGTQGWLLTWTKAFCKFPEYSKQWRKDYNRKYKPNQLLFPRGEEIVFYVFYTEWLEQGGMRRLERVRVARHVATSSFSEKISWPRETSGVGRSRPERLLMGPAIGKKEFETAAVFFDSQWNRSFATESYTWPSFVIHHLTNKVLPKVR